VSPCVCTGVAKIHSPREAVEQATGAPRICLGTDVFDGEAADLGRHEGGGWMGSSEVNRGWSFERVRGEEFGCCAACGPKGEAGGGTATDKEGEIPQERREQEKTPPCLRAGCGRTNKQQAELMTRLVGRISIFHFLAPA